MPYYLIKYNDTVHESYYGDYDNYDNYDIIRASSKKQGRGKLIAKNRSPDFDESAIIKRIVSLKAKDFINYLPDFKSKEFKKVMESIYDHYKKNLKKGSFYLVKHVCHATYWDHSLDRPKPVETCEELCQFSGTQEKFHGPKSHEAFLFWKLTTECEGCLKSSILYPDNPEKEHSGKTDRYYFTYKKVPKNQLPLYMACTYKLPRFEQVLKQ